MSSFLKKLKKAKESIGYKVSKIQMDVALLLEFNMQRKGLSRADMAKKLGVSRAYMTKMLKGDQNFSIANLVKFADALDCEAKVVIAEKGIFAHIEKAAYAHAKEVAEKRRARQQEKTLNICVNNQNRIKFVPSNGTGGQDSARLSLAA